MTTIDYKIAQILVYDWHCLAVVVLLVVTSLFLSKVYGVDWNSSREVDQFLSASWDHTVKLVSQLHKLLMQILPTIQEENDWVM